MTLRGEVLKALYEELEALSVSVEDCNIYLTKQERLALAMTLLARLDPLVFVQTDRSVPNGKKLEIN